MLQVGHDPGPIQNAALRPRQLPLRFLEFPFGVSHALALNSIQLWINRHKVSGSPIQAIAGRAVAFRLLRSPEYRLRD